MKVLELFDGVKVGVRRNGDVYTLNHTNIRKNGRLDNRKGKLLKPKTDKYGYNVVTLSKNGIRKTYTIHRLVALTYLPNPENKPTVNHIDGNKQNNTVENLEWADYKEQKIHAWENNLAWKQRDNKGRFLRKEVMENGQL